MSRAQDADYQPKPEIIEHPARVGNGFDLRTHIKDAKTGETIKIQPYRRFSVGLSTYFERPKFSGNLYYEDNKPAGRRISKGKDSVGNELWEIDLQAKHIDYVAATTHLTRAEDIAKENETLRAELAALQAEKEAKLDKNPAQAAKQK